MKKIITLLIIYLMLPMIAFADDFKPYNVEVKEQDGAVALNEAEEPVIIKHEEILVVIGKTTKNEKEYLIVNDINGNLYYIEEKNIALLPDITEQPAKNDISIDLAGKEAEKSDGGTTISSKDVIERTELSEIEIVLMILGGGFTLSLVLIALKNKIVKPEPTPTTEN